jgi:nucleotide-binding universal stress UspA family protein
LSLHEESVVIRTILTAVDESSSAAAVMEASLEVGKAFEAKVYVFRAVHLPQDFPAAAASPRDNLRQFLEREAQQELQRLSAGRTGFELLPVEGTRGQPWRAIIAKSESLGVDLIVVGSHSYSQWDRLLGTNSGRVANHASRSVLIVHTPVPAGR